MIKLNVYVLFFLNINSICSAYNNVELESNFINYLFKYDKSYNTQEEFKYRYNIYSNNLKKIEDHNSLNKPYKFAVNQFTDMLPHEFNEHKGFIHDVNMDIISLLKKFSNKGHVSCNIFESNQELELPDSIDWRDYNAVSNVKNQGRCGSCWSFSSTGAIEGAWAIKNSLVNISEQQLIDCSRSYGDLGCHGGIMDNAFSYAIDNGMCSELAYPYDAKGHLCKNCNKTVFISSCTDVTPMNQLHLKEAVAKGPVSVAIEADKTIFQSYSSGVITSDNCGTDLDHGVLIVGYGIEDDIPYWLVKNSWGVSWGDNGYVKIARSDDTDNEGVCGIAMQASYVSV
tara:strand:+ start:645 stop:1667 length:1023 start_codon:yes stop_codon:yes gene_type:complete